MPHVPPFTRRGFLRTGAALAASTALRPRLFGAQTAPSSPFANIVANYRALGAKTPVTVTPLAPKLFLLQGVGGNMAALLGPDGTLLVDTSVRTAAPHILEALATLNAPPLSLILNTHWHFDHTDGNAALHTGGAHEILAQENTLKRLSAPQYMQVLDVHFDPAPPAGRPTRTFTDTITVPGYGQAIMLQHFAPAHTDSDIYVWFPEANVLHVADIWFNGFYPLIDDTSGGRLPGMIAAADTALKLSKADTKIIPGHGALGTRAGLQTYRDMLSAIHDRVAAMKASGKSVQEVIAAKPSLAYDPVWGKGLLTPDQFVTLAYRTS